MIKEPELQQNQFEEATNIKYWPSVKITDIPLPKFDMFDHEKGSNEFPKYHMIIDYYISHKMPPPHFKVPIYFYMMEDENEDPKQQRTWTVVIPARGGGLEMEQSKVRVIEIADGTDFKPTQGHIDWVQKTDDMRDCIIEPPPENAATFLMCFWFHFFYTINPDILILIDAAKGTARDGQEYDLAWIRAFAGKPSIYSTFEPNNPPPGEMTYLQLINAIKNYPMTDVEKDVGPQKMRRIRVIMTKTDIHFETLGPVMTYLWYGHNKAVRREQINAKNQGYFGEIDRMLKTATTAPIYTYYRQLMKRYENMEMNRPLAPGGWKSVCKPVTHIIKGGPETPHQYVKEKEERHAGPRELPARVKSQNVMIGYDPITVNLLMSVAIIGIIFCGLGYVFVIPCSGFIGYLIGKQKPNNKLFRTYNEV